MALINLLSNYPKTKRNIKNRLINKDEHRKIALKFEKEYFDGKRATGYGGYYYDGRWISIANKISQYYKLKKKSKILDIGCAKGFLVKDLLDLNKNFDVYGIDVSKYAVSHCHPDVIGRIHIGNATNLPFPDNSFDFVISINTLHNLSRRNVIKAIKEINRVSIDSKAFIQIDAYENDEQREKFINWMLTAKTFGKPEDWYKIFKEADYKGDYYWTII